MASREVNLGYGKVYRKVTGAGTSGDPDVTHVIVDSAAAMTIGSMPSQTIGAALPSGSNNVGGVYYSGPIWKPRFGTSDTTRFLTGDLSGATNWIIAAPLDSGGNPVYAYIDQLVFSAAADMTFDLIEETSGDTLFSQHYKAAAGSVVYVFPGSLVGNTAGKRIRIQTSATDNARVGAFWHTQLTRAGFLEF